VDKGAMKPILSILIPTFNYLGGLQRILSNLYDHRKNKNIEILIQDDSSNIDIKLYIESLEGIFENLVYRKNSKNIGAVNNWNKLLTFASGEYSLILHHDEYPLDINFIDNILKNIKLNLAANVFILKCYLKTSINNIFKLHFPLIITKLVINYLPEYLLKRNIVGPLSCVIFRSKLLTSFDGNLCWFVDVDAVYSLLIKFSDKIKIISDIIICSEPKRSSSITSLIKNNLDSIKSYESNYLKIKYPNKSKFVDIKKHPIIYISENIIWLFFRVVSFPFSLRIIFDK
jgi:glycosyltransferase involved in cell wall biosynthesis